MSEDAAARVEENEAIKSFIAHRDAGNTTMPPGSVGTSLLHKAVVITRLLCVYMTIPE